MKIYTKTGDLGLTSLYNGDRLEKNAFVFECLGDFDYLNSHLGLLKAFYNELKNDKEYYNPGGAGGLFYKTNQCLDTGYYYEWFVLGNIITDIQCLIMDISTFVATPGNKGIDLTESISTSEKLIDRFSEILPPLKNFLIPSGNKLVSQTHVCRVLSRKCERNFISFIKENPSKDPCKIQIYLNRLSDLLFMISRFIAFTLKIEEDTYSPVKGIILN